MSLERGDGRQSEGQTDLAERAYRELRQLILTSTYTPGMRFPITYLADRMGLSRTPVREAARRLEQEGLLIKTSGQQPVVAEPADLDLESWYALRLLLEAAAIHQTVPRLSAANLAAFGKLLKDMKQASHAGDLDRWEGPHREFHRMLLSAASPVLRQTAEGLSERTEWARRIRLMRGERWRGALEEHEEMFSRVRERDAGGVLELLVAHYIKTLRVVLRGTLDEQGEVATVVKLLGLDLAAADLQGGTARTEKSSGTRRRSR